MAAHVTHDELNAEVDPAELGESGEGSSLFVRAHSPVPSTDRENWRLRIERRGEPLSVWSLTDLDALPSVRIRAVLECAGNGRSHFGTVTPGELPWGDGAVGCAAWEGPRLRSLLTSARTTAADRYLGFSGADRSTVAAGRPPFVRGLALDRTDLAESVLLATRLNGRPLPDVHGGPVRLVVPGWYGMAWVKWLDRIEVLHDPVVGHFQTARYVYRRGTGEKTSVAPVERIRVKSLVMPPRPGAPPVAGRPFRLRGRAWSGAGRITNVDVDIGDGWGSAEIEAGDGPFDWSGWSFDCRPPSRGPWHVRVRATDASGTTQPDAPWANEFQYGYNAVTTSRLKVR